MLVASYSHLQEAYPLVPAHVVVLRAVRVKQLLPGRDLPVGHADRPSARVHQDEVGVAAVVDVGDGREDGTAQTHVLHKLPGLELARVLPDPGLGVVGDQPVGVHRLHHVGVELEALHEVEEEPADVGLVGGRAHGRLEVVGGL